MFYIKHKRVYAPCGGPNMTKQSHKAECDINNILRQYQRTGIMQHINSKQPFFEDLPSDFDFQSSMNLVLEAEAAFAALPSVVRRHFDNDPSNFLAAFQDASQRPKLEEWGLLKPARPADPAAAPAAPAAPAAS